MIKDNKITESAIENFEIKLLEKKGYQYFYGPDIAQGKNSAGFVRENFEEIVLVSVLKKAIEPFKSINRAVYE
jgi:hypothetical protein